MKPAAPAPRVRPSGRTLCALAALFAAGAVAATTATSSAAPLADCILPPPLSCPTVSTPTLPISVTLTLPTTTTAPSPAPPPTTTSAPPTLTPPAPGGASPAQTDEVAASAPFSYAVGRITAQRIRGLRRIDVRLSLSHPAMVVAILHRGGVPSLVAVRAGRAGANWFVLTVPARIHAGRYALKLVFGTGVEQHTFTQRISVPR